MDAGRSFDLRQLMIFQGFPKQQNKIRNILVLAHNIPGGFSYLEEGDI
jgi:hypothetical protein